MKLEAFLEAIGMNKNQLTGQRCSQEILIFFALSAKNIYSMSFINAIFVIVTMFAIGVQEKDISILC